MSHILELTEQINITCNTFLPGVKESPLYLKAVLRTVTSSGTFEYSLEWLELTSVPLQGNFLKDSLHFLLLPAWAGYKDTVKKNETKQKNT